MGFEPKAHAPLRPCGDCRGLVPPGLTLCPHCDRPVPIARTTVASALGAVAAGALSMVLMACYGLAPVEIPSCPDGPDNDGDGHHQTGKLDGEGGSAGAACLPTDDQDCDDTDATKFPGADDPIGDNKDTNCDGHDGDPCPRVDKDNDGYGYWEVGPNPQMPTCWYPVEASNEDCDDNDPNVGGPCDVH